MTGPPEKRDATPTPRSSASLAERYADEPDGREVVVSVFGGASRTGHWAPSEETRAVAGFGDVLLDFRQAELPAGITEVDAYAVFGNVVIRAPASLELELSGVALLGNIVHRTEHGGETRQLLRRWLRLREPTPATAKRADDEAVLSIRGTALFGNVVVEVV